MFNTRKIRADRAALRATAATLARWLVLLGFALLTASVQAADTFRVGFFNPHNAEDTFWSQVEAVMQAAADDLAIDLRIYRGNYDHRAQIRQLEQAIRDDRIQAALFSDYRQNGIQLIERAEQNQIPVLLFNTALSPVNLVRAGGAPRQNYRYWIGEMAPREFNTGYQLAQQLTQQAQRRGLVAGDGRVNMVAISGDIADNTSLERVQGLEYYVATHADDLNLQQVVNAANWSRSQAKFQFSRLIRRYPDTHAVWAGNDPIALGALDVVAETGQDPAALVVGGVDWTMAGLDAITNGTLEVSMGGHFLEAGWALVLLHDYLHGLDFAPLQGVRIVTRMLPVGQERAATYAQVLRERPWGALDFRHYSRRYHPERRGYRFDIREAMMELAGANDSESIIAPGQSTAQ